MIEWNGQKFWLIDGYYRRRDGQPLHRLVWENDHGPLPDGFHVHHKDDDSTNNEPGNLVLLDIDTHRRIHTLPKAAAWHRSEEGRAQHRRQAVQQWEDPPRQENSCEWCGATYWATFPTRSRFCSRNCKQNARRSAARRREREGVSPEVHAKT